MAANWQLGPGVIDGVYSQGNNVVLVISGSEFMTLTFNDGNAPTASGPAQLNTHSTFAQLPQDWLTDGFDAGYFDRVARVREHCIHLQWTAIRRASR